MALSPETIEKVNKRLLEPFDGLPVRKTDVGILFGCRSASGTVARDAADLYHAGAFPQIMVAGGKRVFEPLVYLALNKDQRVAAPNRDFFSPVVEAEYMRDVLIKSGVPEDVIVMAAPTQKHANKIVEALREKFDSSFQSATACAYLPYSRRNLGTMRFQGVEIPLDVRGTKPFGLDVANWHESKVASYVVHEAEMMDPENPDGYVGEYTTAVDLEQEARLRERLPVLEF